MMAMETTCNRCGTVFEIEPQVVMSAAGRWRLCDDCRDRDEAEAERLLTDERAAKRARPRDWWAASRTIRRRQSS